MKAKRLLLPLFLKSFFITSLLAVVGLSDGVAQPTGAINGLFSIAEGQYVYFAKGNLQYQASTNTWRFAEHQGDIAGTNNHNISETYSGWIDLFGYGTSGWNSGVVCYQPWSVSNTASDYLQESLTGSYANADWGVYNAISNGGNQPGLWRTLTSDEWNYILNGRPTNSGIRYVKATVNGVCGLILLPDAWNENVYPLNRKNAYWVQFDTNVISASDWTNVLEAHGAVFLPVANNRVGSSYQQVLGQGLYRTANPDGVLNFYDVNSYGAVSSWVGVTSSGVARYFGYSVRLVNAPSQSSIYSITTGANPSTGGKIAGAGAYMYGAQCTLHATPNGHYTFVRWLKNGSQVSTNPTYSFTVTESANYVAEFAAPVGGTGQLNGVFSIDENTQVNFSKGNLQYQASTSTWRFAMNQYEYMGAENENVSPSYSGWIDLFGWGTSGYNHGANCYQPWSTSNNNGDYYAYGQPGYNLSDQSGKADWGYNAISNGGNSTNSGWRTLTSQEWDYLFNNRFTASGARYAKATVNGIGGVILLPDDWNASLYSLDDINNSYADYLNNNITDAEWTDVFETAGAVFLPAAARMISGSIVEEDEFAAMYKAFGFYWSSSAYDNDRVKGLYFYGAINSAAFFLNEAFLSASNTISRNNAASVRLVRPTQNTTYVIGASPSSNEYGTVSGAGLYLSGQVCSLTATANTGYTFTCWTYNGRLVSTNPTYSFVVTENATCKAEFAPNSYGISVSANPSNGGSVSGGGVYLFGSSCTVSAIPNENCSFMYWTVNGVQVSTNAEYTFTVSSDCNLMAHFSLPEVVTYSISASSNLSGGGSIQGTGEYPGNSTCTLMAIANEGYVFESWTEGEFTVSNDAVFSFTVTGNRNLIANYVVSSVGDYVDLGLPSGVLWAACNLGTYKSGSYGDKFAWGETETKDQFNWDSYLYSNGSLMTKYCNNSNYGYNGFTDNLTVLLPMDDAATANWGPAWRMPTIDEWRELLEHTTHTRVYVDGNIGCLFAGTNGNSIFIPIYDYNYPYWSSSLDVEEPDGAMCFSRYQFSETVDYSYFRRDGNYVRPVRSGSQSCVIGGVADPPEGGSVSGSGNYNIGSTVTISASPNAGYHFVRWTKNGKPVSTNPTHSFTVKTNASYVAEFSKEYNISAISNPSEGGTISGVGTYEYGTTATLTASANEGYSFANWTKNGNVVSNSAVYTFTVTGDGDFVANFNQNSYYIAASVNSSGGGTVIGGGSYSYGSTASLIATADICYKFSCWKKNGVVVSLNPIYNYAVTENASFEAFFEKNRFTISVSADPSVGGAVYGAGVFNQYSTCLLKAVPNAGYSFEYWTKNGSVVSTSLSYSFMVTEDADYVAVFSQNNYAVSVTVIPSEGGTVSGAGNFQQGQTCTLTAVANNGYTFANWTEDDVPISTDATYSFPVTANRNLVAHFLSTTTVSITASANPTDGGTVSGMGAYYIGSTCTLIATANQGYSFMYWTKNGSQVSNNATYSFTVAGDCALVAHFSPPLTITASTDPSTGGGSVAGDGVFNYGTTCTLTATANPGYTFVKWTKNGTTVSYLSPFSFNVTDSGDYIAVFEETVGIVIGEPEGANVYLPSYSFYKHTLSQQIYTSEEIGGSTPITGISFFNTGGQKTRSYDIYLVHTDRSSFSNNKDWITVTESDRVFSGDVTMMAGCWTTIVLDVPFTYNGTSNLAIVIDDNSGNYTGSPHMSCRVFNTQGNQAIRVYSDGTNYDPFNPSGYNGTLYSEKNQIVFQTLPAFAITASASPSEGGTITGAGSYFNGRTCTLTAIPNEGYYFVNWTENGEVVSTDTTYSFTVTGDRTLVANFEAEVIIEFADALAKSICVENWDTNGDGELSVREAAAVTNIGQVFRRKHITSFEELQYFTGLTAIGYAAFDYCSYLTGNLIIPSSVTTIGGHAFDGCGFTGTLIIPNSVTYLGDNAFIGCRFSGVLTLPSSVTGMGTNPFASCNLIESIVVDSDNPAFDSRNNCNAIIATGSNELVAGCKNTVIPNSVTSIGSYAFYAVGLTNIEIPNSVTLLGNYAFYSNSGLTQITIPNSVTSMGTSVFQNCRNLVSATLSESLIRVYVRAFRNCSSLTQITLPNSIEYILDDAFYGCSSLTGTLTIPSGVKTIMGGAFYGCNFSSVVVLAETPPAFNQGNYSSSSYFSNSIKDKPIYVPCNSMEAYQAANVWSEFTNYQGIDCLTQTQTVQLSSGWNWFSTYLSGEPTELLQMLENSLGSNGIVIKSNAVSTDYYEDYGWYGDLDDEGLKSSQMYMIKTNAACTVELEGVPATSAEVGITIRHGWNWIGFPCAEAMSVAEALSGFQAEDGDILKSSGASTDYYEGFGWYGELETMEPGQGFMYYSNSQATKTVYFQTGAKKSLTGRKN